MSTRINCKNYGLGLVILLSTLFISNSGNADAENLELKRECDSKLSEVRTLLGEDKTIDAIKLLDNICKHCSSQKDLYLCYYHCYMKQHNYTEAIQASNKFINLEPSDRDIYTQRAIAKYHLKQYQEALKDLDTSISLAYSPIPFTRMLRGLCNIKLGNPSEAKEDLQKAAIEFLRKEQLSAAQDCIDYTRRINERSADLFEHAEGYY